MNWKFWKKKPVAAKPFILSECSLWGHKWQQSGPKYTVYHSDMCGMEYLGKCLVCGSIQYVLDVGTGRFVTASTPQLYDTKYGNVSDAMRKWFK